LIFSPKKLDQFEFLDAEAGDLLDKRALDELRRQSQSREPKLTNYENGTIIQALEAADKPIIVDIQVPWKTREG